MNGDQMKFGIYSTLGSEPAAQSLDNDLSHFSRMHKSLSADSLFPCNVRTNSGERNNLPPNRHAATFKRMHKTEHRFRGVLGVDIYSRFGVNADAQQARHDSELPKVNAMRKTNSTIHDAVHDAAKAVLRVSVTHLVAFPQLRSWYF